VSTAIHGPGGLLSGIGAGTNPPVGLGPSNGPSNLFGGPLPGNEGPVRPLQPFTASQSQHQGLSFSNNHSVHPLSSGVAGLPQGQQPILNVRDHLIFLLLTSYTLVASFALSKTVLFCVFMMDLPHSRLEICPLARKNRVVGYPFVLSVQVVYICLANYTFHKSLAVASKGENWMPLSLEILNIEPVVFGSSCSGTLCSHL
jgi:hypothetical protein